MYYYNREIIIYCHGYENTSSIIGDGGVQLSQSPLITDL
jgi:hypothetical protein